jgi:uncharacterized protein (TIGR02117 family)
MLVPALAALVALGTSGCAGAAFVPLPSAPHDVVTGPPRDVWVVRHGWHTRIAVRRADVDPSVWPESLDIGETAYIEVGWGDRDFYPDPNPSVWDAIDPVIRATPAALHVGGFDESPLEVFPGEHVVRLAVPADGIDRLARFIHEHYVRDRRATVVRIRPGHYPRSWFYLARGRYHALTFNSNNWTAAALRAAGAPMDPGSAATSGAVMRQASEIAERTSGPRSIGR